MLSVSRAQLLIRNSHTLLEPRAINGQENHVLHRLILAGPAYLIIPHRSLSDPFIVLGGWFHAHHHAFFTKLYAYHNADFWTLPAWVSSLTKFA